MQGHVTEEMIASAREHFQRRAHERSKHRAARGRALYAGAERAATVLSGIPGVTRVVLFGSVALGRADAHSDIDLAVTGLPAERYLLASADAADAAGAEVDLVPIEEADASLLNRIVADGIVLYERS